MHAVGNFDQIGGIVRTITTETAHQSFNMLKIAGCTELVASAIVSVATTNKVHIGIGKDQVPRYYSPYANDTFIIQDHGAQVLKETLEKVFKAGFTIAKVEGMTDLSCEDLKGVEILKTISTF